MTYQTILGKFWNDKNGKLVLFQAPNTLLYIWLFATVTQKVFEHGIVHNILNASAFGALFAWSYLEISSGVNYFRRTLGVVVMVAILANRV